MADAGIVSSEAGSHPAGSGGAPASPRRRTHTWDDPTPAVSAAATMSGFDYLTAILRGALPTPPICTAIGFRIAEVGEGHSVIELEPAEHQYNTIGTVHGGVIVTVLDSAAGNAVHSTLPAGTAYTTVDLSTTFLRPVNADHGVLRCVGTVVNAGRRIAVADAVLTDTVGKLYARATATCLVMAP